MELHLAYSPMENSRAENRKFRRESIIQQLITENKYFRISFEILLLPSCYCRVTN